MFFPEGGHSGFLQLLSLESVPGNAGSSLVDPLSDSHAPPSFTCLLCQPASCPDFLGDAAYYTACLIAAKMKD